MKHNWKKLLALLTATTMMTGMLSGCGKENEENDTNVGNSQVSSEKEDNTVVTDVEDVEDVEFSYPMDGRSITYGARFTGMAKNAGFTSLGETECDKNIEKLTGIHLEYVHPTGDAVEWFNNMVAAGTYPDVVEFDWNSRYPGGLDAAYNDGVIIELNDVIDQYMPNFKAWLAENPEIDKQVKNDAGQYLGIPSVTDDERMGSTHGVFVRQDMLDELGLKMPETISEWHDVLTKVKEHYEISPISCTAGYFLYNGTWLNAYAPMVNGKGFAVDPETGKVNYTCVTDGYREFLTTMAQWYKEGLIDPDIASVDDGIAKAKIISGESFANYGWVGGSIQSLLLEMRETDPDFDLAAAPIAKKDKNSEVIYKSSDGRLTGQYAVITKECQDVEAAARRLDFMFSEEGILASNFGIEGVSYTLVDGVPTYTEEVLKDINAGFGKYIRSYTSFVGVQDWNYLMGYYKVDEAKEALTTWGGKGTMKYNLPTLSYTTEENEELAQIMTDVDTVRGEYVLKFLLGTLDIESEWDNYVNTLEGLGLSRAIEITTAAYERYQAR